MNNGKHSAKKHKLRIYNNSLVVHSNQPIKKKKKKKKKKEKKKINE